MNRFLISATVTVIVVLKQSGAIAQPTAQPQATDSAPVTQELSTSSDSTEHAPASALSAETDASSLTGLQDAITPVETHPDGSATIWGFGDSLEADTIEGPVAGNDEPLLEHLTDQINQSLNLERSPCRENQIAVCID